jgi:hypothetical protein
MQVKKVKLEESKKRERRAASFKFVLNKRRIRNTGNDSRPSNEIREYVNV